jgi:transcriptional regulator with XRE-family HTH domain
MPYSKEIIVTRMNQIMALEDLSVNAWCERSKVAEGTLRSFLKSPKRSLRVDILCHLADAVNRPVSWFLGEDEGLKEARDAASAAYSSAIERNKIPVSRKERDRIIDELTHHALRNFRMNGVATVTAATAEDFLKRMQN